MKSLYCRLILVFCVLSVGLPVGGAVGAECEPSINVPRFCSFRNVSLHAYQSGAGIGIMNHGTCDLHVFDITLSGDPSFSFSGETTATIAPLRASGVLVNFAPESVGWCSAILTIESDDPDEPSVEILFNGNGVDSLNPVADAGLDRTVFDAVVLNGSHSYDPDGAIVSFKWSLRHKKNSAFDRSAEGSRPVVKKLKAGFYDVTLTVTDDAGLQSRGSMVLAAAGPCMDDASGPTIIDLSSFKVKPEEFLTLYGKGFGDSQEDSVVHFNKRTFDSDSPIITYWSDNEIEIEIPKFPPNWFKNKASRKRVVWLTVDGENSNRIRIRIVNPGISLFPSPVLPSPVLPSPVLPSPVLPSPVLPGPVLPRPVLPSPIIPAPLPDPGYGSETNWSGSGYESTKVSVENVNVSVEAPFPAQ